MAIGSVSGSGKEVLSWPLFQSLGVIRGCFWSSDHTERSKEEWESDIIGMRQETGIFSLTNIFRCFLHAAEVRQSARRLAAALGGFVRAFFR